MDKKKLTAIKDLLRWKVPFGVFPVLLPAIMLFPNLNWGEWGVLLFGALATVLMVHVVDDIFGYLSGTDVLNADQKDEIGHSKALVRGDISLKGAWALVGVLATCILVTVILLLFVYDNPLWLIFPGLFTIFWGYSYSGPPLKLSYRGLGETVLIVCGGIAPVTLCYYMIAGEFTLESFWIGTFIGGIFSSVLNSAQQADIEGDIASGRNTLTVLLTKKFGQNGPNRFLRWYHLFWWFFLLAGILLRVVTPWLILLAFTMPFYLLQWKFNGEGDFYAGRNASMRAWRINFFSICLVYLLV